MFAQLTGKITGIKQGFVVLDVSGVGYKVNVSAYTLGKVAGLGEAMFHIHTHVREDQLALYGFLVEDELDMFELLISIPVSDPRPHSESFPSPTRIRSRWRSSTKIRPS